MATFHRQGIQLWGGSKWEKQMRFQHAGVKLIEFSPNELYVVTFAPQYFENDDPKDPKVTKWRGKGEDLSYEYN